MKSPETLKEDFPVRLVLLIIITAFVIESLIMLLMPLFEGAFSPFLIGFIDAAILILAFTPILYLFIFRPLDQQLQHYKMLEKQLFSFNKELEQTVQARTAELDIMNIQLQDEIVERKQTEHELRRLLKWEGIVAKISTGLIKSKHDQANKVINEALESIGSYYEVDRSYVFIINDDEETMDNTHEWCTDGIEPQIDNLKNIPVETTPWWMTKLYNFETIYIPCVAELPVEAKVEKEILEAQDIQSLLVLPLAVGNSLIGFIGYDSVRQEKIWKDEHILGLELVGNDIVNALQRTIAEKRLKQSEERFELAMEGASDGLWDWDLVKDEVYYSPRWKRMLGYAEGELKPHVDEWKRLMHPEDLERSLETVQNYLAGKSKDYNLEFRMQHKDGHYVDILSRGIAVRDEQGKALRIVGTHVDISERKQAETRLEQANNMKELLLDVITHDLINPAGTIREISDLLLEEDRDNELIQGISWSSDKLLKVVQHATVLSQVAIGDKIAKEEIDLLELVKSIAPEFVDYLKTKEMILENKLPGKLLVHANPIIGEVFKNYISNAIKYASDGKKIIIDAEVQAGSITINVRDYGTTIPENDREKVFTRGIQIDEGSKRGRGIGLAIVKRIAEVHGAEVGVSPNKPQGNIFYIKITVD
ncbi:MAG: PAS domain-containing protein [Candidatus Marinimicrobia bacterium]|nr:PAS domain-containing protein [Candidatus Neomarinimicrobiota bacterium]